LQLLGARRTVLLDSLKPFVAWILGATFLQERSLSARAIAGLALTVGGVAAVAIKPADKGAFSAKAVEPQADVRRRRKGYLMAVLSMLMDTSGSLFTRQHGNCLCERTLPPL
jgi:drug/metabolite transporter (DMT)-like permease